MANVDKPLLQLGQEVAESETNGSEGDGRGASSAECRRSADVMSAASSSRTPRLLSQDGSFATCVVDHEYSRNGSTFDHGQEGLRNSVG